MPGSKISNASENHNFAASMHLKLRREVRKVTGRWEKARPGLDYKLVKIMCFNIRQGLLYLSLLVKKLYSWTVSMYHDLDS